jgi:hypothetical protein
VLRRQPSNSVCELIGVEALASDGGFEHISPPAGGRAVSVPGQR